MILIGIRLIPDRRVPADLTETFAMDDYIFEIVLLPGSMIVGKAMKELLLGEDPDFDIIEVYRDGIPLRPLSPDSLLKANDVLSVRCDLKKIREFQEWTGGLVTLRAKGKLRDEDSRSSEDILVEAVIAPNSPIVGKSLKEIGFRDTFGATVLAVRHREEIMHGRLATVPLEAGDALLIEIRPDHLNQLKRSRAFALVSEVEVQEFKKDKMLYALAIIFGVVASAALGLVPIVVSAIVGCVLLVLTGCITLEKAYEAIEWRRPLERSPLSPFPIPRSKNA